MSAFSGKSIPNKKLALAHLGATLCVLMWGVSFVSTKVLLNYDMQPVEIYLYRFILAYLLVLCIKPKPFFSHSWRDEGLLMLCGVLAGSIYFLAENFALRYTLVSNVSLLTSTSPLITALLIGFWYRTEKPKSGMIVGSLVAFIGVGCVIFNSSFALQVNPLGDLLSISCAFSWTFYSIILRKLSPIYSAWFLTRKTFFYGVITALPFMYAEPPTYHVFEVFHIWPLVLNIVFLGLGASVIAYVLWAESVKSMGPVTANNYLYVQPIVTLVVSVLYLHEQLTFVGCLGCVMILAGLWLGSWLSDRQAMKAAK